MFRPVFPDYGKVFQHILNDLQYFTLKLYSLINIYAYFESHTLKYNKHFKMSF